MTEFGIGDSGVIALRRVPKPIFLKKHRVRTPSIQHPVSSDEYQTSSIFKPPYPKPLNFEP
ncbi:MAG: hypothetical protein V2J65_35615 [Desulfobacteraceae bacterium]|nr:hypothetical protein [Desulfobacteraceae bacterium]